MARKKHKAEEIIQHLRTVEIEQAKGLTLEEASRKVGVTYQTLIRWRKEFGGLDLEQVKRLKELDIENEKLRKHQTKFIWSDYSRDDEASVKEAIELADQLKKEIQNAENKAEKFLENVESEIKHRD